MRVLFTSPPGWGHVHPMVPLAKAFLERGDEVGWATAAEVGPRLERDGFHALGAGLGETESMQEFHRRFPELAEIPLPDRPLFMFPRVFGVVRAGPMLGDLLPLARDWRPALVVADQSEFAGPIVAASLGVPNVTHSFGSLRPEPLVAAAADKVAPLWEAQGLTPRPYGGTYDHLYLDIYPESLQTQDAAHVGDVQPLRPIMFAADAGDGGLPALVTEPSSVPLVYVTFGTVFNKDVSVIATVVRAAAELQVRVVATVGPAGDPAALGDQPANVSVRRYIPQTELLSRCAAVVSHGGSGTFLAAVSSGLPQLCVPQGADQFDNAAACVRSGAGLMLGPGGVGPESVREALKRVLGDPAFGAAAARVGAEIAAMPPPAEVAEVISTRFGPS